MCQDGRAWRQLKNHRIPIRQEYVRIRDDEGAELSAKID